MVETGPRPEQPMNNPPARIKRWIAKPTVIGGKNRGGLGNMDKPKGPKSSEFRRCDPLHTKN